MRPEYRNERRDLWMKLPDATTQRVCDSWINLFATRAAARHESRCMASCSAQMSDFDSSLARDGSGRNGASPVRTGSAALLSGADIWSSAPAPARLAERIAERAPPGIAAEKA